MADRIAAACDTLLEMRHAKRRAAALPADVVPRSVGEGYRVQDRLVAKLLEANGGRAIGYKIACTSELAQRALGVDGPFFGVLMAATTYRSGVTLPAADYLVRCAEAEFGFEMGDDVPAGEAYTAETIEPFVRAVIPSIEVVDHRYHDWQTVGAPSLLADNAIHGFWVEGEPVADFRHIDFAAHPTALVVNGTTTFPGSGAAVLGNPLNVVAWLANELPRHGRRLRAGDKVTTGVTTGIYLAGPGDHLVADFGPLGRAEMRFV
jgi:2-keto-4-pentenoate hydratase